MADTEFDIIVYGATGYTGRLVAEHFVREYGNAADAPKWAMAGRSMDKLEAVRDEIGAPADTPLVVADADDAAFALLPPPPPLAARHFRHRSRRSFASCTSLGSWAHAPARPRPR